MLWKLAYLDDEQLRRVVVPSGTSLLGLVEHLAAVEYRWFCKTFGRQTEAMPLDDDDPEADLRVEASDTTADLVAFYRRARASADPVIGELDMDTLGRAWWGDRVSMRWVLIHMIEETARHAGHMDSARAHRRTHRRPPVAVVVTWSRRSMLARLSTVKSRYPHDSLAPVGGRHSGMG